MDEPVRIAVLFDLSLGYCRDVLSGVEAFARGHANWSFYEAQCTTASMPALKRWAPHGVVAHLVDRELADELASIDVPVVNVTSTLRDNRFPLIEVYNDQIGQLAAQTLRAKGFDHFGFFGSTWAAFSLSRERSYVAELADRGFEVSVCHEDFLPRRDAEDWNDFQDHVRDWVLSIPKPCAVFASNDVLGRHLLAACRMLGIKVPQEMAILACDNDEFECGLSRPTLSSIALPGRQIGREAAQLLHHLITGGAAPEEPLLFPPVRVVGRESTESTGISDPDVLAFLRWADKGYAEDESIDGICRIIGVGRRTLERKVKSLLGHSVLEELRQRRILAAKELLAETDLSIEAVAQKAGYKTGKRLCAVFAESLNVTPQQYRRTCRAEI